MVPCHKRWYVWKVLVYVDSGKACNTFCYLQNHLDGFVSCWNYWSWCNRGIKNNKYRGIKKKNSKEYFCCNKTKKTDFQFPL